MAAALTLALAVVGLVVGGAEALIVRRWRAPWADPSSTPARSRAAWLVAGCVLAGAWAAVHEGATPPALVTMAFGCALLLIAWLDAEHLWLPRSLTLPLGAAGLLHAALLQPDTLLERGVGWVAGVGVLALLACAYRRLRGREGLGGGDKWMLGAAGAWIGWQGLPTVLIWACLLGLSLAAARALVRRDVAWSSQAPLGAYMAFGAWLTWLYGALGAQPPL